MEEEATENLSYRLTRNAGGLWVKLQKLWDKRLFRWFCYALILFFIALLILWATVVRNLPDAEALLEYESPLPTVVRNIDGEPFHSYARQRRVSLEYGDLPDMLVKAYLSAEDKTFFEHGGIDYPGIAAALLRNIQSDGRPVGASTITQQVAKNLLLTNEVTYTRKLKEALLAYRIESSLNKQQILSLYLNEIFLGRNSYGVEAASQSYFGKSVDQLELHQMAYLAILPKGPSNYRPETRAERAIERRNWVLGEMQDNGWISDIQRRNAQAKPLDTVARRFAVYDPIGDYFVEEIRRQLIENFGETSEAGPYSVYNGGLWVRSSLHPRYQKLTTQALRDGLIRYDRGKGWSGPIATIPMEDGKWQSRLASSGLDIDYRDWEVAVVLERVRNRAEVGLKNGDTGIIWAVPSSMKVGDVITVAAAGKDTYVMRSIPGVGGGMVVQDPRSGRVLAMQGGFDARISSFNRATQAQRQPGSTIKPFVYASALDQGMTPTSIIVDGPFCVWQSTALGRKCFRNFGGSRGAGPKTMRWGLEQSRNLMTVRAANDAGMGNVTDVFRAMDIGDYPPFLAFALGAGDTTVMKMTNAYSMLVNHGRKLQPTLIDFVQDRRGKVIWPSKWQPCRTCNMDEWDGKPMPRFRPDGKQVMDPVTSYQVVHMLEGVVQRGTATLLKDLDRPIFGKTGTTSGPTNVWFVGGAPNLVAGVYLGYDQPKNMGSYAQGGSVAAPVFKQFAREAFAGMPALPFVAPKEARLVRVDRQSGKRVFGQWPGNDLTGTVIWEAFKPETEPKRTIRRDEIAARTPQATKKTVTTSETPRANQGSERRAAGTKRDDDFLQDEGGIY